MFSKKSQVPSPVNLGISGSKSENLDSNRATFGEQKGLALELHGLQYVFSFLEAETKQEVAEKRGLLVYCRDAVLLMPVNDLSPFGLE